MSQCKEILWRSVLVSAICMGIGTAIFEIIPGALLSIFSDSQIILQMGTIALRIIAISFVSISMSLVIPTYFQAIGKGWQSIALTFPITEVVTALVGLYLYRKLEV